MDSEGNALDFTVLRGNKEFVLSVAPEVITDNDQKIYRIGIERGFETIQKPMGIFASFTEGVARTYRLSAFMIRALGKIITGKLPKSELGGPIMIAKMAGDNARAGIDKLISFIALISINLAILNFLPIPVLDGGHLMFFTIEILKGSPVSIRTREIAQQTGMIILLLLMVFVFYNDLSRVFSG
jgi:regulator of sigma E protease